MGSSGELTDQPNPFEVADDLDDDSHGLLRSDIEKAFRSDGQSVEVHGLKVVGGGRSAMTAAADVTVGSVRQDVIVRAQVGDVDGIAVGTIADQFALLERLHSEGVGAPIPILYASRAAVTECYDLLVVHRIPGDVPNPWTNEGRLQIAALRASDLFKGDFVERMARIHSVDPESLPSPLNREGRAAAAAHPDRLVDRVAAAAAAGAGYAADPLIVYVERWLRSNQPRSSSNSGLVHGDYRMGNMVVNGGRLVGVLDWELAEAGERLADVAWLSGPQGQVDGFDGGLFESGELVERYAEVTGIGIDPHQFEYHVIEGSFRTTGVWLQLSSQELAPTVEPGTVRALLSVLQMKEILSGLLWPGPGPTELEGQTSPIALTSSPIGQGVDLMRRTLSSFTDPGRPRSLDSYDLELARRASHSFGRRLEAFESSSNYADYSARVHRLHRQSASVDGAVGSRDDRSPGAILSEMVKAAFGKMGMSVHSDGDSDLAELRSLVRASALPTVAPGDLLWALGTRQGAHP